MTYQMQITLEISNLINPAFCGEILRNCIKKFEEHTDHPMPFSLCFLVLPLVLNEQIRKKMRYAYAQLLPVWIIENDDVLLDFATNSKRLIPFTLDAIMFLMQQKAIEINNKGKISVGKYEIPKPSRKNREVEDCYKKSQYVGTWFGIVHDEKTIFSLLGVKP